MMEFATLILGVLYGFFFGLVPVAGASTALIAVYGFISFFQHEPYLLVIFTTATVVACAIGDNFSSIMMNIPGSGGSQATVVDGFPMAQRGEAARALSAAAVTSGANGLIWGLLVLCFLPFYAPVITAFAIPEMLALTCVAILTIVFVNSVYWFRGLIALGIGIFLGMVGHDSSNSERFTFGWFYLQDGIQLVAILAGVIAFPELVEALFAKGHKVRVERSDVIPQIKQGFIDSWRYRWDGLRGGAIGGLFGLMPGVGGNIVDWLAYSQTIAWNKKDPIPFGQGNVRGLVGCEGANNAQKATAYIPTVLFGVPAAPFEAVVMALLMYVGLEMGSPLLLSDQRFFSALNYGYLGALALTFVISIAFIRYAVALTRIPTYAYIIPVMAIIVWSCVQYTGGWEDYAVLAAACCLGVLMKYCKLSRAAFIIGFVMAERIEANLLQYITLYQPFDIFFRPISASLIVIGVVMATYGLFFNRSRINYV